MVERIRRGMQKGVSLRPKNMPKTGGRGHAYEPTKDNRECVELMAGFGIPHLDIAKALNINPLTLRKYYSQELDSGGGKFKNRIANALALHLTGRPAEFDNKNNLIRDEVKPSVPTAIFLGKTRLGLRETEQVRQPGLGHGGQRELLEDALKGTVSSLAARASQEQANRKLN